MLFPFAAKNSERNEQISAEQLSDSLPPLLLKANQLVKEFNPGIHGRRKAGTGEDFWQFKQYSPDVAASEIDWRQSAKGDQLYVRQKELETAESVWFWRDASPSMAYSSKKEFFTKLSNATVLTLATGLLLTNGGENFGLLGISKRASHGPVAFDRFSHDLMSHLESDLETISVHSGLSKNTHIVLISDFLYPLEEIEKALRFFSNKGCRGVLIQVADPSEIDLPFTGRNRFHGLENNISLTIGRVEAIRDEYQTLYSQHKSSIRSLAQTASWDYLFYRTDQSAGDTLASLYQSLQWGG